MSRRWMIYEEEFYSDVIGQDLEYDVTSEDHNEDEIVCKCSGRGGPIKSMIAKKLRPRIPHRTVDADHELTSYIKVHV